MRYLPLTDEDRRAMLDAVGAKDIDALFRDVPDQARLEGDLELPGHAPEMAVEAQLGAMAARNTAAGSSPFFCGAGAYRHHVPATVGHLIERAEFLTAYTPYQPEISQGTLQYLFEFQTQVAELTGMEVANASMYDGSTACAEAVLMARRVTRRDKTILSGGLHPHYAEVTRTVTQFMDDAIKVLPPAIDGPEDLIGRIDEETSAVVVQTPGVFGHLYDLRPIAEAAHEKGALLIAVVSEAVSFGALESPGAQGADIVVAEGQSIGNPLNFGGPYLGLFATRQKYIRQMPGRLAGETVDADGRRGYVLTLSTREQHIRREKATSNICTNSGLCALAFCIHMTLLGGTGLARLARLNHAYACALADAIGALDGATVLNDTFFNEFTVRLDKPAAPVVEALADKGILAGVPGSRLWPGLEEAENLLLVAATETADETKRAALIEALAEELGR